MMYTYRVTNNSYYEFVTFRAPLAVIPANLEPADEVTKAAHKGQQKAVSCELSIDERILAALAKLEHTDAGAWTATGAVNLNHLNRAMGLNIGTVTKNDVHRLAPDLRRDMDKAVK